MKTLYLDCSMGAAGDMLAAALLELQPDPAAATAELNALGLDGVEFVREPVTRCGIAATHLSVRVNGEEEVPDHSNPLNHPAHLDHPAHPAHPDHLDHHHHAHRSLADIFGVIDGLRFMPKVVENARAVYSLLAAAEGRAHGCSVDLVHFHEVGALDAVADIVACCFLMDSLAPEKIVASPVHVGFGSVRCAHGTLPVPAPATAFLLEGVPAYSDGITRGELCTPTGAALLRHFVSEFGPMPLMRVAAIGHGAGMKDFPRANVVRALLGEGDLSATGGVAVEEVLEIACNIDDMTGEDLAFAAEEVRAAGALDVWMQPALMKKGRPGTIFLALCDAARRDAVVAAVLRHTTTLGVRETRVGRTILSRGEEVVATPLGDLRRKVAEGNGIVRAKFEHDDLAAAARARGVSLAEARALAKAAERR